MTEVLAHRGASAYEPENTMRAFLRAAEMGADGIELDINHTADGRFAVWHDREIEGRALRDSSLAEVRDAAARTGAEVPELAEVLAGVPPSMRMYVEIKTLDDRFDAELIETLRTAPHPDRCAIHSFDHRIIQRLARRAPEIPAGVLSSSYPVDPIAQMRDAGATVLWQHHHHIDRALLDAVHQIGGRVIAWTVDNPNEMTHLQAMGTDGICTNTPDVGRRELVT